LDEAVATARSKGHATAMINAATLRSRLGGLLVDKAEVTVNGDRNEFAELSDFPAVAKTLAAGQLNDLVNARWLTDRRKRPCLLGAAVARSLNPSPQVPR
jgi:hypothetical protein